MSTRGFLGLVGLTLLLTAAACAESTKEARSANDENAAEGKKSHDDPDWYDSGSEGDSGKSASDGDKSSSGKSVSKKRPSQDSGGSPGEPAFKEGMSVNDAINAVPQGYPRVNIDQEDLNAPLMDPEFYKPCKPAHTQHFTIKFAVWEGRAVGMDIKSTPANKALEQCLHGLVGRYTWKDKVKSLNISEVQF